MAPKPCTSQSLSTALCISLLLLILFFILGWGTFTSINSSARHGNLVSVNRKALSTKFNFTAFHGEHRPGKPDPADLEIDPRYGVEKRKVPTGPNPLHH